MRKQGRIGFFNVVFGGLVTLVAHSEAIALSITATYTPVTVLAKAALLHTLSC